MIKQTYITCSIFALLLLLNIMTASADSFVLRDTIRTYNYRGEQNAIHTLGDQTYTFVLLLCSRDSDLKCFLKVNSAPTGSLQVTETYTIDENYYLKIDNITKNFCDHRRFCNMPFEAYDIVDFSIYTGQSFCGDANCDAHETCSSCSADCGQCQLMCGDEICDEQEICEEDNCCDGTIVDLDQDYDNCGLCQKQCTGYEVCDNGACVQICGNGYCESDETCDSCAKDCANCQLFEVPSLEKEKKNDAAMALSIVNKSISSCGNGYCEANEVCDFCIEDCGSCETCGDALCQLDEDCSSCEEDCGCNNGYECFERTCITSACSEDKDCDDQNACTVDRCSGTPKTCSNQQEVPGCNLNGNCVALGTKVNDTYCSISYHMETMRQKNDLCTYNYECVSDVCSDNRCVSEGVLERLFTWFKRFV
ncbi:hypothetical protein HYW21_05900 [Candidatus Woesearchaeota archaeon]|nr:hypothetical protein [Candidatus Woesearchaeota archaeon]